MIVAALNRKGGVGKTRLALNLAGAWAMTVDMTLALGGRIKIAAVRRGVTVADMPRDLLARAFPPTDGEAP